MSIKQRLVCRNIDLFIVDFGIHDPLSRVQTELAAEQITYSTSQCKQQYGFCTKQFHPQNDAGKGTVGDSAEGGYQSYCRRKTRVQSQQWANQTAKGGTDKKGGNNFAAAESAAQCDGGKQELE